jgi:uncharacterized membrane protein
VTERSLRVAIAVLALAGAAVSAYLTITKLADAAVICPTSGCETVQRSSYSELLGVPVAAIGLLGYLAVGATALWRGAAAAALGAALAGAGVLFAGYLLVLQLAVIEAVCTWCVTSDVTAALLAVAAFWRASLVGTAPASASPA